MSRRRLLRPFPFAALALAAAKNGEGRPGERGEHEVCFDIGDLNREGDRENEEVLLVARFNNIFMSFGSRLACTSNRFLRTFFGFGLLVVGLKEPKIE